MATTKITSQVLDLNAGRSDYSLTATNTVTYVGSSGGNQYVFNGAYGTYGVVNGTYVLSSVSSSHPIAIINNGKTSEISYTGVVNEGTGTGPDGNTYTFYSGNVTITVSGNFDTVSYYCLNHGYMGGKDNLIYVSSVGESGLKIPSGTDVNRPTAATGQIRNNTNETSDGSASCEEYYNGTEWKKINNVPSPVYYRAVTYSGNSGTQSITGFGFQPDLIWIKRTNSAEPHALYDSTRGINKQLEPNSTAAEATNTAPYEGVNSFDADGFTTGDNGGTNRSPNDYVAWAWAANGGTTSTNTDGTNTSQVQVNSNSGLSIVSGTASGGYPTFNSFGHGLGTTPGLVIVKQTTGLVAGWAIWHQDYANTSQDFMNFNATTGTTSSQYVWGNQAPTSSVFSITDGWTVNVGAPFIAYCFAEVAGFSSFGSYTGNATAGQAITTGFQPTFILIKSTVGNANWRLYDTVRGITAGGFIRVQGTNAQDTQDAPNLDITSTGFEINANGVTQGLNASGNLYIYIAFK